MRPPAEPLYRERLFTPWWWWPFGIALAGVLALEFPPQLPTGWQVAIYAAIGVTTVGFLVRIGAARIQVDDHELRAGPARIELRHLAGAHPLDETATRRWLGPQGDPAAYLLTRWWIHRAVLVVLDDPEDDTPYWLLSSRRPDVLASRLTDAIAAVSRSGARPVAESGTRPSAAAPRRSTGG